MLVLVKIDKKNRDIIILNICILLFIFRTAIPFFKYPFIIIYPLFLSYTILKNRLILGKAVSDFFRTFILPVILILILIIAALLSYKFYLVAFKEIVNSMVIFSFFFLLIFIVQNQKGLLQYVKLLSKIIFYITLIITIFLFLRSIYSFLGIDFYLLSENLNIDYNFSLIPIFFGIIYLLFNLSDFNVVKSSFYLLLFSINIILSTSKRGMFILLTIFFFLIFLQIISLLIKNKYKKIFIKRTRIFILVFFSVLLFAYLLVFQTSARFKNRTLNLLGIENSSDVKFNTTIKVYRYYSIFKPNISINYLYRKLWIPKYDPRYPDSGWGSRVYTSKYHLSGINCEIIPKGTVGYMMDNTTNATSRNNNAYSYTKIKDLRVIPGDSIVFSVFCFVSEDFNGNWAKISMEGVASESNYYDLKRKNTWQKLEIKSVVNKKGKINAYLYWAKYNVQSFKTLKGYIIFAYPQIILKKSPNNISLDSTYIMENYSIYADSDLVKNSGLEFFTMTYNSIFRFSDLFTQDDPIRRYVQKVINEDSTYIPYSAGINIDTISNKDLATRFDRWQFAWQIFLKEYNWPKKLIGGGFSYLNWYGAYFYKDKTRSDWPHNPFLSALLYSGIVGLLLYIYLMYKVVYYYWLYRKAYPLLGIFFLITFFFSFFSANNPFDPPVMGFFVILPFFIHYIHTKKEKDLISNIDN